MVKMLPNEHGYDTQDIPITLLSSSDTLVGESGGLSSVFGAAPSNVMQGMWSVDTEHGTLYLDEDLTVTVLDFPAHQVRIV